MRIITSAEFDGYWNSGENPARAGGVFSFGPVESAVNEILAAVFADGDNALRRYAAQFDRSSPEKLEVPGEAARAAWEKLGAENAGLCAAIELAASRIRDFSVLQRKQFFDFESETADGLVAGQRIIPVTRAAVYVPAGRFPLFSSVLMGLIPAFTAGVEETVFASPPMEDGLPDYRILAASHAAARLCGKERLRIFAMGGAQAIAALAFGTQSVPKVDVIVGPGNKYVAAAKRLLFGEVGIDFIAGPTDVLVIADGSAGKSGAYTAAELAASDMLAQAEHDPDAGPRALVNSGELAAALEAALEKQLRALPEESQKTARASLEKSGVIIVYGTREEAVRAANIIAPEHLELQVSGADAWAPFLKNYGSLFIGGEAAEVLGDYSAGINHTLPTSGSARFSGGLSVRHFLKTVTTLRSSGVPAAALGAAEMLGRAEGLSGHAESAALRLRKS